MNTIKMLWLDAQKIEMLLDIFPIKKCDML